MTFRGEVTLHGVTPRRRTSVLRTRRCAPSSSAKMRSKSSSPSCTLQAGAPPYRPDATGAPPYRPDATGAPPYRPDATAPGAGDDGTRRLSSPHTPARAAARQRPRVPRARLTPAAPCGAGLLVRRTIKGSAPPGGFARSWEVHEITPQGRAQLAARKARASPSY